MNGLSQWARSHKPQVAAMAAAIVVACLPTFALAGCGGTGDTAAQTSQADSAPSVETEQREPVEETPADNVSITDVSMAPIEVCSASVDSYDAERGYVIDATVSNDNEVSCDVTPHFAVDITGEDDYGAEQTQRMVIYGGSVFTPYGLESMRDMQPVGLAPHETKNVRYYVYLDGASPLRGAPLEASEGEEGPDEETGALSAIDLSGGVNEFYSSEITALGNVELVGFDVEESEMVYLPADEWSEGVALTEEYDDGSSWGGYPTYESIISGSVANATNERWLSAEVQFDFTLSGQALNDAALRGTYYSLDHVDTGASAELREQSVATAKNDYDVVLTPALLAYEPDDQSSN